MQADLQGFENLGGLLRSIELFATEVAPVIRKETSAVEV